MNKRLLYMRAMGGVLLLGMLFNGCKKKNDFIGRDNFIASFSLKKGSTTFSAVLTDSSIIIKAPEGFSLDSATASVTLSEHASIYPRVSEIVQWNEEALFVVSAYDGVKKTYRYTVQRSAISVNDNVVLATQADVDAFGAKNVTEITGNLIIGAATGTDSITNLNGLYQLKKIGYSLIIYPTFSATEIMGLDHLQSVGGDLRIEGVNSLIKVGFPLLESAKSISIKNLLTENVQFPRLRTVAQGLSIFAPLNVLSLPALQQAGGAMTLFADETLGSSLIPVIAFPSLTTVGDISIQRFKQTTKLDFPLLVSSGGFDLPALTALYDLSCPKLQKASGPIVLPDASKISLASFPSLTSAAGLQISGKSYNAFEFPLLKTVGNLMVRGTMTDGLKDFTALTSVTGELFIGDLPKATGLNLPGSLKQVKKLTVYNYDVAPPQVVDIRGLAVGELNLQTKGTVKVIGDKVFHGTLTINPPNTATFPTLQGFSEVDSLSFGDYISYFSDLTVMGIHTINKSFSLPNNSLQSFGLPDLEEVGGNVIFTQLSQLSSHVLSAPALKKIGGDLQIATGYDGSSIVSLSFPILETIGGRLRLYAEYAPWNYNTGLTDLNGFSALTKVQGVNISGQYALTSYVGLQNAFGSIDPVWGWNASGNAYSPSYNDLNAGNWTKP